ncbi:hypothetical protein HYT56_03665 [Candidatus Woesearchaeota archaeon]|nr:hypothetical protein [Candidatus Woesearchaeota archaeon]
MKLNKCPECRGKIEEKNIDYILLGVNLGKFPTMICSRCREQFYEDSVLDKIDKSAKEKGLWGLEHKTKLNLVGNSLAVRLSKNQIEFGKLKKGEEVIVYPESKNKFIIEVTGFKKS